jgi:WD40 repeat protein
MPGRVGRFELLDILGSGAFGTVYKARDPGLDRLVAVKVPHPGEPAATARFLREARSAAQLRHPGIVPIHEVGEDGGQPYLVSEWVAGDTLANCLRLRRYPPDEAARLIAGLADALHYAHTQGVIHRDVKPTNVMIDATGQPRLLDFGLARRDAGEATMTTAGQVLGTPAYMSPEQARGEGHRVDGRADVYSLGVILYLMLTGEPPFRGNARMLLRQVLEEEPRPPRRLNDRVPRDLETVCLKCLGKEPASRYASAADLGADLRRFLAGRPVLARPVGRAAKLGRWCRRNPALAGALAAAFVALAAVAIVALLSAYRLQRAADELGHALDETERKRSELQQTNEVLAQTDARRRQALRQATYLARDRGLTCCEQGDAGTGLLWLARALEIAPEDDPELVEALREVRQQMAAWRGCVCSPRAVPATPARVWSLAFSPDGRLLLTGDQDGGVMLWRADTGALVGCPWRHKGLVRIVAFSADGRRFASVGHEDLVRVGDTATRQPIGEPIPVHGDFRLAIAPDGKTLAVEAGIGGIQLWDVGAGRAIGEPIRHEDSVRAVAFSPDSQRLATGGHDNRARLWDAGTGRPVGEEMSHQSPVVGVAFSPDGKMVLTWSHDRTARLWDAATGRLLGTLSHQQPLQTAAFSPDGRLIATGCGDTPEKGEARVWDAAARRQLGASMPHPTAVQQVGFSRDGRTLLTRCLDGLARLWEAETGRPFGAPLVHGEVLSAVAFSPDGASVATLTDPGALRLWDAVAYRPPGTDLAQDRRVAAVAFSPDGQRLLTGGWDHTARQWDARTGQPISSPLEHPNVVLAVAFSPDGRAALTACADKLTRLWDLTSGRPADFTLRHRESASAVAFGPGGRLLTASTDGTARMWDSATGRPVGAAMATASLQASLAVSPDGRTVVTNGPHPGAHLWDAMTGQPLDRTIAHPGGVMTVAFSPDGRLVLTGGQDRTARLWDAATGRPVGEPLTHHHSVGAVAFSGDGRLVATGTWGGDARLWLTASGRPLGPWLRHPLGYWVWTVALSPDGRTLATGSGGPYEPPGEGRLWPVPPPLDGSAERLMTWAQVQSGLELDAAGVTHLLDGAAWEQRRRRLEELGGSPR